MLAWTPGTDRAAVARLRGAGFDLVAASLAWWDGRARWLVEEIETLRDVAPAIGSPEPSFGDRLAGHLPAGADICNAYRHALHVTAAAAAGLLLPMGFEYATRRPFDAARATPDDLQRAHAESPCDLTDDVAEASQWPECPRRKAPRRAFRILQRRLPASSAGRSVLPRAPAGRRRYPLLRKRTALWRSGMPGSSPFVSWLSSPYIRPLPGAPPGSLAGQLH